jgi:thiamine biosynthesis lipoprotein
MSARASTEGSHTMRAWSCTMRLAVTDQRALRPAARDLTDLLERVDAAASRFRPDSALSVANARAGRPVPVPALLVDLVGAALDAAARSNGAVDPTVGRVMHAIGYDRDIATLEPDGAAIVARPARLTWRDVRLDREVGLLTVPAGTALDLGATAKAYVADLAARTISERYHVGTMVELGGDIAFAGKRLGGWQVRVAEREGLPGQVVTIREGGLTTSTTTVRQWRRGGRLAHHIVDPRTGLPTDGLWRTASVYAPSALLANTGSTAAIVKGAQAGAWLQSQNVAARLVARDGSITTVGGWPLTESTVAVAS